MIDLHCHSHFSDGLLSPEALVQKAQEQGLSYLSLTDHDTVSGYESLIKAAEDTSLTIINGIELSTCWKKHDIHVLGYQIEHSGVLMQAIEQQNQSRITRAIQIGDALEPFGIHNAYQKACDLAGHSRVGRPHFAQVLVNEGFAKDMQNAFKRYLGRGKPAFVPTPWMHISEAVNVINQSGGVAVIAHPLAYGLTRTKVSEIILEFIEAGGRGIEVVSGEMTKKQIIEVACLSTRYKLLASSGSDYHGDRISKTQLGRQQPLPGICTPIWNEWTV